VIAGVSVKHSLKPPNLPKLTRGYSGLSGWCIQDTPGDLSRAEFRWLLDVDLCMSSMLNSLVDKAIVNAAIETLKCLRQKLEFNAVSSQGSVVDATIGTS